MKQSITRKAILIGCPGNGNSFLSGVAEDLSNMQTFLQSDKGGKWFPDEITTLINPTCQKLFSVVHSTKADYNFIYFSGHGFTNYDNSRMLALYDKDIKDLFLINASPRQLIIIDACRNYVAPGISGIPDLGEDWFSFDGDYEAREMFNTYILHSPHGRTIIHGTQIGEYSYDSLSGGYFTKALLNISTTISVETYMPIFIKRILDFVPKVLQKQGNSQIPCIAYTEGNLTVPFAIAIPHKNKLGRQPDRIPQRQFVAGNENSSGASLAFISLALLLLIAASK